MEASNMEWNIICRVCLQEGEMQSIFDRDDDGLMIAEKIMLCSELQIISNQNLPKHICSNCHKELNVAYEFRSKCESSNEILESFADETIVNDVLTCSIKGKIYKYEPPAGLNIKRIRKSEKEPDSSTLVNIEEANVSRPESEELTVAEILEEVLDDKDDHYEITEIQKGKSENVVIVTPKGRARSTSSTRKKPYERKERIKKEKPPSVCNLCGNAFKYRHALETHMRRHRNEKPFSCEICGRSFVLNVELTCHMRTHTGQKPYACRFCERRFSDFGSRIKHERSHTGERPYSCETCGKAFAYSYGLSSHLLIHTGEKRYQCEKCNKRFTKKHHLTNHLKTHLKQESKTRAQQDTLQLSDSMNSMQNDMLDSVQAMLTTDDEMVEYVEVMNDFGDEFETKSLIVYEDEDE